MTCNCEQCGTKTSDPLIILWAIDMGKLCKLCFDEIVENRPVKQKREMSPALQKAHEVRSKNAEANRAIREELKKARIESNPERYQRQLEAIARAQAGRKKKQEQAPEQPSTPEPVEEQSPLAEASAGAVPSPAM